MKKVLLLTIVLAVVARGSAQSFDIEQLLLDVTKLGQLKQTLQDMKDGYEGLKSRYSSIGAIVRQSFGLHKDYLDGLLAVSPMVRNYERIVEIAALQTQLIQRYQSVWGQLMQNARFRPDELVMLGNAFSGLVNACAEDLDDLVLVVTDGMLRASDAERLQEIDSIYERMRARLAMVNKLGNETLLLGLQRSAEAGDASILRSWFGITP